MVQRTPRRRRVWSNTNATLAVTVADQPGQRFTVLGTNLLTGLGLAHLAGYTVKDTHVQIMASTGGDETDVTLVTAQWGIGIFTGSIDAGDFPQLDLYEGDWLAYGSFVFKLPGTISTLVTPTELAVRQWHSAAMRKIDRVGEAIFFVIQHNLAVNVNYTLAVSQLWLMP